jgi:biopolymer transport protein TolR
MGMTVSAGKNGPVSDPNIVPLIDVLLVLITIFMVITSQVPSGLPTLVPQPAPPQMTVVPPDPWTIVVQVMQGGKVLINQEETSWDSLGGHLLAIFEQRADKVAFVKGEEGVEFAQVARAIDIMRGAGIGRVGLVSAVTLRNEDLSSFAGRR